MAWIVGLKADDDAVVNDTGPSRLTRLEVPALRCCFGRNDGNSLTARGGAGAARALVAPRGHFPSLSFRGRP